MSYGILDDCLYIKNIKINDVDLRNLFEPQEVNNAGLKYFGIGRIYG